MSIRTFGLLTAVLCGLAVPLVPAALADDHGKEDGQDHDRARELYERGEIHSLHEILEHLADRLEGEVVGVELVPAGSGWLYRIQLLDARGRRSIVEIDAADPGDEGGEAADLEADEP